MTKKFLSTFKEEVYEPANALGKGDYDNVIEIHKKYLNSEDPKSLLSTFTILAKCYDWKGDTENGYINAKKALELAPNDFDMLVIVTRYWFEQKNEDKTYEFVVKTLSSEPPQPSKPSIFLLIFLKLLSLFSKKYNHSAKELSNSVSKTNKRNSEITKWAIQYKTWYEKENYKPHNKALNIDRGNSLASHQ